MLIGYARTSTLDQTAGLEAQRKELENAGCEKLFEEQVSSVLSTGRPATFIMKAPGISGWSKRGTPEKKVGDIRSI